MARSDHGNLSAADRWERRSERRHRPVVRRQSNRRAVVAAALAEVSS